MTILLILLGVFSFMILVITHELGHFFAAKKSGVKVNEFGIGLPPRICKVWTDKSGTEYTINAIPLGGFCVLEGDDPNRPEATYAKNSFVTAKLWKKLIIMIGGVTVNLLTAFVIFMGLFWHGVTPIGISSLETSDSYLIPGITFAEEHGILTHYDGVSVIGTTGENSVFQTGEILIAFNGTTVSTENLAQLLEQGQNQENTLQYLTTGEVLLEKNLICEEQCNLGNYFSMNSKINEIKFDFFGAIGASFHEIGAEWELTFQALGKLGKSLFSFNKEEVKEAFSSLSGPVGAIKMGEIFFKTGGWTAYLAFIGILALALAIFNLLPIPALDGGSGLCLIIQSIFKISHEKYTKYITYINAFFFRSLMVLGIVIIFKDLVQIWGVPIPFI